MERPTSEPRPRAEKTNVSEVAGGYSSQPVAETGNPFADKESLDNRGLYPAVAGDDDMSQDDVNKASQEVGEASERHAGETTTWDSNKK